MSKLIVPGWQRDAAQKISDGYNRPCESMGLRKDGNTVSLEVNEKSFQPRGRSLRITAARNIAERKYLESQLISAQNIAAVGQLAGGVSHEFNNILTAMVKMFILCLGKHRGEIRDNKLVFVSKPLSPGKFLAKIREVLES